MQWWMTSHVRRYHCHYRNHGHVWQGLLKAFRSNRTDMYSLSLVRNPVRRT
jgi:putative transposase